MTGALAPGHLLRGLVCNVSTVAKARRYLRDVMDDKARAHGVAIEGQTTTCEALVGPAQLGTFAQLYTAHYGSLEGGPLPCVREILTDAVKRNAIDDPAVLLISRTPVTGPLPMDAGNEVRTILVDDL